MTPFDKEIVNSQVSASALFGHLLSATVKFITWTFALTNQNLKHPNHRQQGIYPFGLY